MKKLFLLFFALFVFLFLFSGVSQAADSGSSGTGGDWGPTYICNESSDPVLYPNEVNGTAPFNKDHSGKNGIVPCGNKTITEYKCLGAPNYSYLGSVWNNNDGSGAAFSSTIITQCRETYPGTVTFKEGGKGLACPCGLSHVFVLIFNVYKFIVLYIATPLAALLIVLGGAMWVVSAGNPGMLDTGKRMFKGAIWGIALIFGSWIIVNVILIAIGYTGGWSGITF